MTFMEMTHWGIWGLVVRQLFALNGVLKSKRYLSSQKPGAHTGTRGDSTPLFYIIIPVLREAACLRDTVAHFRALAAGHKASIIIVTTAREAAEATSHPAAADTIGIADAIARNGDAYHLHSLMQDGLKGDQINHAVEYCVTKLLGGVSADEAFVLVYDADSRPPHDSLDHFERAIVINPEISVFHQSSRFELRVSDTRPGTLLDRLQRAIADSGALRANRFVLAYEIPRLLNRSAKTWSARRLFPFVFAHVTGHGLCIRLSFARDLPFPSCSPLEDMHYSFLLCSRNVRMLPVGSMDSSEVPNSITVQFGQLSRWFWGPARFRKYLADPKLQPGWRSGLLALSAAGITIEWLSCSVIPFLLALALWFGDLSAQALTAFLLSIYSTQLALAEHMLGADGRAGDRILRFLTYPIAFLLFGIAGINGLCGLILQREMGKTERN